MTYHSFVLQDTFRFSILYLLLQALSAQANYQAIMTYYTHELR